MNIYLINHDYIDLNIEARVKSYSLRISHSCSKRCQILPNQENVKLCFQFYFTSFIFTSIRDRGKRDLVEYAWTSPSLCSSLVNKCTSVSEIRWQTLKNLAFYEVLIYIRCLFRSTLIFAVCEDCDVALGIVLSDFGRLLIISHR